MMPALETRCLLLHPLQLKDAQQVQEIFPVWGVVEFLNDRVPWPFPPDGVHAYYRDQALPAIAYGDEWHWTLRLRSGPDRIIGSTGLFRGDTDNRGFWLGVPWQRQGLMTEASDAVTAFWFDILGFPLLRVRKAIANAGSRRISEKSGMRLIDTSLKGYVSGTLLSETWEITAEEWHRHRAHAPAAEPPHANHPQ